MDDKKIARINELYHKSKSEGLTAEEKAEQQKLEEKLPEIKKALKEATILEIHLYIPDFAMRNSSRSAS